jgi:hypothetical protein
MSSDRGGTQLFVRFGHQRAQSMRQFEPELRVVMGAMSECLTSYLGPSASRGIRAAGTAAPRHRPARLSMDRDLVAGPAMRFELRARPQFQRTAKLSITK